MPIMTIHTPDRMTHFPVSLFILQMYYIRLLLIQMIGVVRRGIDEKMYQVFSSIVDV